MSVERWTCELGNPHLSWTGHPKTCFCGTVNVPINRASHWEILHLFAHDVGPWDASLARKFVTQWTADIAKHTPRGCGCAKQWESLEHEFDCRSRAAFQRSATAGHNLVNAKLSKSLLTLREARALWGDQPNIDSLVAVTSLSPRPENRLRQQLCLTTWRRFGLRIHAVQTHAEALELEADYPQVSQWHECESDRSQIFDKPTQLIFNLCDVARQIDKPVLLINSDIELRGQQSQLLNKLRENVLFGGIRQNYREHWWNADRERWGIDAFLITPEMATKIPRMPFAIGKPYWDYWLPYHFRQLGYSIDFEGRGLFYHRDHDRRWSQSEWNAAARLLPIGRGAEFRKSLPWPP